jgi:DNA-binding MarR family transcriptional regulator
VSKDADLLEEAVSNLRALILAGEHYRQVFAQQAGLGVTETQALSYLASHGDRGQTELAADLGITTGAATALVDRLERRGMAQRFGHPSDRRRVQIRLTDRGRSAIHRSQTWLGAAFQHVPPDQIALVSQALSSIGSNLRQQSSQRAREEGFPELPDGR